MFSPRQGQQIVVKDGFFPVFSDIAQKDMGALGIRVRTLQCLPDKTLWGRIYSGV